MDERVKDWRRFKAIDGLHAFHAKAYGSGMEAKYDADDGEVCISTGGDGAWLSADEARALRDWLNENVKD